MENPTQNHAQELIEPFSLDTMNVVFLASWMKTKGIMDPQIKE